MYPAQNSFGSERALTWDPVIFWGVIPIRYRGPFLSPTKLFSGPRLHHRPRRPLVAGAERRRRGGRRLRRLRRLPGAPGAGAVEVRQEDANSFFSAINKCHFYEEK